MKWHLALALAGGLAVAAVAHAAIYVLLSTTTVHRAGVVRLAGNTNGMPLYALPATRYPCARTNTCAGPIHLRRPPRSPYVPLGRASAGKIRLPRTVKPGRYKVFVWCERCGGSLIIAGRDDNGQTLHVIR